MFPVAVILLELGHESHGSRTAPMVTVKHIVLSPMVLSTLIGMLWSVLGFRIPGPVTSYLGILADALTPCALFAIGLGLSIDGLRANIGRASLLSAVKLVIMPLIVYGLSVWLGLDPLYTIAAVICAAVPTAKTAFILAGSITARNDGSVYCFVDNAGFRHLTRGLALLAGRARSTYRYRMRERGQTLEEERTSYEGLVVPALKHDQSQALPEAEALLPPHESVGSHNVNTNGIV